MTEEQIKAIAEEYADYYSRPIRINSQYRKLIEEAENVLTFLSDKYCVVEKSEVVETYNEIDSDARCISEFDDRMLFDYDVYSYFYSLFGSKMFNQN